jgi:hypothetical protein
LPEAGSANSSGNLADNSLPISEIPKQRIHQKPTFTRIMTAEQLKDLKERTEALRGYL